MKEPISNFGIYRKTFSLGLMRVVVSFLGFLLLFAIPIGAFLITSGFSGMTCRVSTLIGVVLGILAFWLVGRFGNHVFRAGQIAMIARGVRDGELPDNTYGEGKKAVKERFAAVSVYYLLNRLIHGITNQITSGVRKLTNAIGRNNQTVQTIGGIVNAFVSAMLKYVDACCLGWVFLHPEQNAFRATCDGAVIYFKNWKTLLKNTGKIVAIGLVSFLVIGGAFFGLVYLVFGNLPVMWTFAAEITERVLKTGAELPFEMTDTVAMMGLSVLPAILLWSIAHSAFVQPIEMISVMRSYLLEGLASPPEVKIYEEIRPMSSAFRKAEEKAAE